MPVGPAIYTPHPVVQHYQQGDIHEDRDPDQRDARAYTPLISGDLVEVLQIGFFSLFGIYATYAVMQWYAEGPIGILSLPVLITGAVGAYWPLAWLPNIAGAAAIIGVIAMSRRATRTADR